LAHEAGAADVVDPLAGSYMIETLTAEIEARAREYLDQIDAMGGMVAAIQAGFPQRRIEQRAYEHQLALEQGTRVVVGQNRFVASEKEVMPALHRLDPAIETAQRERTARFRASRDGAAVQQSLDAVERIARSRDNLLPAIVTAVKAHATLGEISDALRRVFGEHR
jgi:methylmalonyl-CoA mutase N-terminal domain/subunit